MRIARCDSVDFRIIEMVTIEYNCSFQSVAERLNITVASVHARIGKLKRLGILKHTYLDIDLANAGFVTSVFIGISLETKEKYKQVIAELYKMKKIIRVNHVTGPYCLLAEAVLRDQFELLSFLREVNGIDGIDRTTTLVSLEEAFHKTVTVR